MGLTRLLSPVSHHLASHNSVFLEVPCKKCFIYLSQLVRMRVEVYFCVPIYLGWELLQLSANCDP